MNILSWNDYTDRNWENEEGMRIVNKKFQCVGSKWLGFYSVRRWPNISHNNWRWVIDCSQNLKGALCVTVLERPDIHCQIHST